MHQQINASRTNTTKKNPLLIQLHTPSQPMTHTFTQPLDLIFRFDAPTNKEPTDLYMDIPSQVPVICPKITRNEKVMANMTAKAVQYVTAVYLDAIGRAKYAVSKLTGRKKRVPFVRVMVKRVSLSTYWDSLRVMRLKF